MNARQKAKKYKKECERLNERLKSIMSATKVQPYIVKQHSIVTLRAELLVDSAEIRYRSASEECKISRVKKMLAAQLLHNILNYAKIETCENPYGYSDKTVIRATMKVVDTRREKCMTTKELLGQAKIYAEGRADALKQVKEHYSNDDSKTFFKWLADHEMYSKDLVEATEKSEV